MTSRHDSALQRARILDAEMRLQRAWLELNLRDMQAAAADSPWARLKASKFGTVGLSFLRNRSLWLTAVSYLASAYRKHTGKSGA